MIGFQKRLISADERRRLIELVGMVLTTILLIALSRLETRLFELSRALSSNAEFSTSIVYFGLININVILVLLLSFLIFRNIAKLVIDRRRGVLGSRLKTKLVVSLVFFAVAPTILMFFVSTRFITTSFDTWFSSKVRETMQQTREAGAQVYKQDQRRLESLARIALQRIRVQKAGKDADSPSRIDARRLVGFESEFKLEGVGVYDAHGNLIWEHDRARSPTRAEDRLAAATPGFVIDTIERFKHEPRPVSRGVVEADQRRDVVKGAAPIYDPTTNALLGIVVAEEHFETQILRSIEAILKEFAALRPGAQLIRISYMILLGLMLVIILFSATWLGFYVARTITDPIQRLAEATREVAHGNYDVKLAVHTDDETGTLVRAFNKMTVDLRDHERKSADLQRVAAWREVARRIAHEIKNPITPIRLNAERLLRRFTDRFEAEDRITFEACLNTIITQVDSLKTLVNEFSNFSRLPRLHLTPGDINAVVRDVAAMYRESFPQVQIVTTHLSAQLPQLLIDPEQLRRAVLNLAANAVAAMEENQGGKILEFKTSFIDDLNAVRVEVSDNGCGISDEQKLRVFDPYFSTKKDGTGLGLSIVQQIVADHGGYVRLIDHEPRGTTAVMELPVQSKKSLEIS